jgi:hypothetical membrane protein
MTRSKPTTIDQYLAALSDDKRAAPSDREIPVPAARLSIAATAAVLLLLASLHVLSPEFDPSWRVVSEYANGRYGWVLSLMFVAWAVSSWALVFTIRSQVTRRAGKLGVAVLAAAGVGEAMASIFDINHPLHHVAALLGVFGLPVAAMLISVGLSRTHGWSAAKTVLLWTANLTWLVLVTMIASLIVMMVGYTRAGHRMTPDVIAVVGYTNRLLVVLYCVWVMTVAWQAIKTIDCLSGRAGSRSVGRMAD